MSSIKQWFDVASEISVVKRACAYALIVGPILIAINHGDELLAGHISASIGLKMALTMMVPYLVSTFSSVGAMRA